MSKCNPGFVYRKRCADDAALTALLQQVFGGQALVWAFGMNSIHVQPIEEWQITKTLTSDAQKGALSSGHIFNSTAEVRWKRREKGYDTLVLTEDTIIIDSFQEGLCFTDVTLTQEPFRSTFIASPLMQGKRAFLLSPRSKYTRLEYREYRRKNHHVVFIRYTRCAP